MFPLHLWSGILEDSLSHTLFTAKWLQLLFLTFSNFIAKCEVQSMFSHVNPITDTLPIPCNVKSSINIKKETVDVFMVRCTG